MRFHRPDTFSKVRNAPEVVLTGHFIAPLPGAVYLQSRIAILSLHTFRRARIAQHSAPYSFRFVFSDCSVGQRGRESGRLSGPSQCVWRWAPAPEETAAIVGQIPSSLANRELTDREAPPTDELPLSATSLMHLNRRDTNCCHVFSLVPTSCGGQNDLPQTACEFWSR